MNVLVKKMRIEEEGWSHNLRIENATKRASFQHMGLYFLEDLRIERKRRVYHIEMDFEEIM